MAAGFLEERGGRVVARNVRAGRGEVDLVVRFGRVRVGVEVRTVTSGDPFEAIDDRKVDAVVAACRRLDPPIHRIDMVGIVVAGGGVTVRWVPAGLSGG